MRRSKNVQFLFAYRPGEGGVVFQLKKKKNFNRRRCRTKALEEKKIKALLIWVNCERLPRPMNRILSSYYSHLIKEIYGTVAWQIFFVAHARIEIIQPFAWPRETITLYAGVCMTRARAQIKIQEKNNLYNVIAVGLWLIFNQFAQPSNTQIHQTLIGNSGCVRNKGTVKTSTDTLSSAV